MFAVTHYDDFHTQAAVIGRQGLALALVDAAFYPHPDLIAPRHRIRSWVDAAREPVHALFFGPDDTPRWPGWWPRTPFSGTA